MHFPLLKDPMHMSDETIFGKWDSEKHVWDIVPILQYDKYSGLTKVETSAKAGDYDSAKDKLLEYYRKKKQIPSYLSPDFTHSRALELACEKILVFPQMDDIVGEFVVEDKWEMHTIDLTIESIHSTYFLFDADMDGTEAAIHSRKNQSGNHATLELVIDGEKKKFSAVEDTFISAGENADTNYGASELLYIKEAAGSSEIPIGSNTRRTYLKFDLSSISADAKITFAQLKVYACCMDKGKRKKIYVFKTSNEKEFAENEFVWSMHYPQVFNMKETGYILKSHEWHRKFWGVDDLWISFTERLGCIAVLVRRYIETKDERYAYGALDILISLYKYGGDTTDILSTGWRTKHIMSALFGTLYSEHMTGEVLVAILKYAYDHAVLLYDAEIDVANWGSAFRTGFARVCSFTPEIAADGWWEHAKKRLIDLYDNLMLNPDGSYQESGSGYIGGVVEEIKECLKMIEMIDGEDSEDYQEILNKYKALTKYYFDFSMNYGFTPAYGDGTRINIKRFLKNELGFLYNPHFEYFVTDGKKGTEPDYTSILYKDKPVAFLRSNWRNDGLSAFINADHGGIHGHFDDLSLDVYGYGHPLLVDAGNSSYSPGALDAVSSSATISHNTIEVDNKNQDKLFHGKPQKLLLSTNKTFDHVEASAQDSYLGFNLVRKVLFLKKRCWIVSDYAIPYAAVEHTYKQVWHPDKGNGIILSESDKSARTDYKSRPNILIVPADPDTVNASIDKNYISFNGVDLEPYVKYTKENVRGPQTFDTILYPDQTGKKTDVSVERIELNVRTHIATALEISYGNKDKGYYYSSNDLVTFKRNFGDYSYDGQMAYIEYDEDNKLKLIAITKGSVLKHGDTILIESAEKITDLGVEWEADMLILNSSSDLPKSGVKIYSPTGITNVVYNGAEIVFSYNNSFVEINGYML